MGKKKTNKVTLSLSDDLLRKIEGYRRGCKIIPSRPEAIIKLINRGLREKKEIESEQVKP